MTEAQDSYKRSMKNKPIPNLEEEKAKSLECLAKTLRLAKKTIEEAEKEGGLWTIVNPPCLMEKEETNTFIQFYARRKYKAIVRGENDDDEDDFHISWEHAKKK